MAENLTATGWIVFDAMEIDCAGRRVFVAGSEMPLEPKAFAVLHLLASHPGKAFTRDEILDAVWGHRHVTPGVLNRVITLIRQALGESADEHRCLHTLHGVGYRFDAPVRFSAQRLPPEPDAPAMETANAARDDAARVAQLRVRPAGSTTLRAANGSSPALMPVERNFAPVDAFLPPGTEPSPMHSMRRWFLLAAALVLFVLVIAWWWPRTATSPSASVAANVATAPTLVVLPLRPIGTEPGETVLAEGLSEELTTRLARIDGLRMISSTSAALAQSGKFDLPQLAEKLKATHALEGSLRASGDQTRIDLRLIEVPGGRTVWAQDFDRKLADVFVVESEIAQAVAGALALRLGIAANADTADIDPALLRRMLEARTALRNPASYPGKDPETMMRGLLAERPDYAPARGLLALVLSLKLTPGDTPQRAEAQREAELAIQLDANLPEPYVALSRCANEVVDWDRAIAMYRKAVQLAPTDSVYRSTYGYVLGGLGYLDEGLQQTKIGVASDPLNVLSLMAQARMLDTVGRHDEAKKLIDAMLGFTPISANAYVAWFNAVWRHDLAAMHAALDAMRSGPGYDVWNDSYVAATAAQEDAQRWPEVRAAIAESERRARAQHMASPFNYIRLLDPQPDYATVFAGLDMMLRNTYPTYHLLIWMPEYRALRQTPEFQDFLKRNRILDYWRSNGWPAQCKPDGDRARCD